MRLGYVLSKPPNQEFLQVEGFLTKRIGKVGQQVQLTVDDVMLNYYCHNCKELRTFKSQGKLCCVFVNKHTISIDCVLTCGCGSSVQVWFLIESKNEISGQAPEVRILKRSEKLSNTVQINDNLYGEYSVLLDKAERAYREGLGAGAIVYLRKIFEIITSQTADIVGISYAKREDGTPKQFRGLLEKVDKVCNIIPKEFSRDGYKLFRELSGVLHGTYDDDLGLSKFEPLQKLVKSILDNVRNSRELKSAISLLGWDSISGDDSNE